jgi:heme/copper-type cytochrome/quinol oxidase subunit 2
MLASQQPVGTVSLEIGNIIMATGSALVSILVIIIGFFFARTFKQIDENQKRTADIQDETFRRLNTLTIDHYKLKGEHDARGECRL